MTPPEGAAQSPARLWLGFGAMCIGMFMAILDIQVVASSLTAIAAALGISHRQLGWIQTSYLMAEVIAIPLTGLLTRAFSLRQMFAAATFGFTLASLGCALSASIGALVAFRVAQGFFGGMLIPAVFTSVFIMMPEPERLRATTIAGVFALLAPTLGPMVGGYLTQTQSWHWIFLINILPGLAVTAQWWRAPSAPARRSRRAAAPGPGRPGVIRLLACFAGTGAERSPAPSLARRVRVGGDCGLRPQRCARRLALPDGEASLCRSETVRQHCLH